MSDKLRSAFPIAVTFSDGELPTAAKCSALASQAKNGLSILEYAVGDLWNQGGDSFLSNGGTTVYNALMIPNISRFLGAPHNVNPFAPYLENLSRYTHRFYTGDGFVGTQEGHLSLLPSGTYVWTGTTRDASPKSTKGEVSATGNWYVDTATGYVYTLDLLANGDTLTYYPNYNVAACGDAAETGGWNVIPDPATHTSWSFRGCKIAYANNTDSSQGYVVYFPPRGPLTASFTGITRYLARGPQDSYLHGNSANYSPTPGSGAFYYWQDPTAAATTTATYAEHYRYVLPPYFWNSTAWAASATLPTGLIHVWDHYVTKTIITGLNITATAVPDKWAIIVSGAAMDTWVANNLTTCGYPANALTQRDTHTSAYYPANGLRVLCGAQSLAFLVGELRQKFFDHSHGDKDVGFPTQFVKHSDLADNFGTTFGSSAFIYPSAWTYDDHPQYLHRLGYQSSADREKTGNGMLGDLLICSCNPGTGNWRNLFGDSRSILFGEPATGPMMYYDQSVNSLAIERNAIVLRAGFGARISDTTLGTVIVESPAEGEYSERGGAIVANRHRSGSYVDTSYGETSGYGRVKTIVLSPDEFKFYVTANPIVDGTDVSLLTAGTFTAFASSGNLAGIVGKLGQAMSGAGLATYAVAYPPIDAQSYAIMNVSFALCPYGNSLGGSYYFVSVGKALGGLSGLGGDCWSMSTNVDLVTRFGAGTVDVWSIETDVWAPSATPLRYIDCDFADYPAIAKERAVVRFLCVGGTDVYGFRFGPVTVKYRVKEF
jgi:hypothetical protein